MKVKSANKKTILLIAKVMSFLFILMFTTACSNISSAKLVGYDGKTFDATMEAFFKDMMSAEVGSISYEWKEGWSGTGAPNSENLTSNEKAMTYIISINLVAEEETETNRMIFYMIHDTKENLLSVQGGSLDEDGDIYPMTLSEARSELEYIFKSYN